jgi:hypothetical protein
VRSAAPILLLVALLPSVAVAHIGSPHIYLEADAGGYPVIAVVHMPPAIPGEAELQVRLQDRAAGEAVEVSVREVPPQGEAHAPDWIEATESPVDLRFFTAPIPLMRFGVWRAQVKVRGPRGEGMIEIPIPAKRPNPGNMDPLLAGFLGALVVMLLGSGWTMLVVMRRDALREAGEPSADDRRAGTRVAVWGTAIVVAWMGFIGYSWFNADAAHRRMGIPGLAGRLTVGNAPARAGKPLSLELKVRDRRKQTAPELVPDHGKLMHLVAIDVPDASYLLHAHPSMTRPGDFNFRFVAPEAGSYLLFGDVVESSGEGQTVTATLDVADGSPTRNPATSDPDDSWSFQAAISEAVVGAVTAEVGDGLVLRFVDPDPITLKQGEFYRLTFRLETADGQPVAELEPIAGANGHMIVLRHDLEVFTRLYPSGSPAGRIGGMEASGKAAAATASVSFPYGFPDQGDYRCWVQVKHGGSIRTGVFDVRVR